MHRFDAPPFLNETSCQPVEQLQMTWQFSSQTEIARRSHQASAKVMLPNAIHHHARGQRVLRVCNSSRQFETAIPMLKRLAFWTCDHFKKLARHFLPQTRCPAPFEHAGIRLRFPLRQDKRCGCAEFDQTPVYFPLKLPKLFADWRRKEQLVVHDVRI